MTKATDNDLGKLHGALAQVLTSVITEGVPEVIRGKDGEEDTVVTAPASAAYFAAAITFLKNNNITAGRGNEELDALKKALENKRTARAPTLSAEALEEAAELFGQRLQ